uniref:Uncharacterized protein n=1 Tax=Wuchereria bancrofti TaxID=6293 RepID=A0AAF5PJ91_WUCBA
MEVNTVDYLTNDLQVADLSEQNLDQLNELHGRLKSLITRLRDEPKLLQSYDNTIREQLACDMIEEVTPEMNQEDLAKWQSLIEEWPQFIKNIPRKTMDTNDGFTMHVRFKIPEIMVEWATLVK